MQHLYLRRTAFAVAVFLVVLTAAAAALRAC